MVFQDLSGSQFIEQHLVVTLSSSALFALVNAKNVICKLKTMCQDFVKHSFSTQNKNAWFQIPEQDFVISVKAMCISFSNSFKANAMYLNSVAKGINAITS